MTLQDLVGKGVAAAREAGNILKTVFHRIYTTDSEVIGKYVLLLLIAGLLILGLRLLGDELEEYRVRKENQSGKLPWYFRGWVIFLAIVLLYAVIFVLISR